MKNSILIPIFSGLAIFCSPVFALESKPAKPATVVTKKEITTKNIKSTKTKQTLIPPPPPDAALLNSDLAMSAPLEYLSLSELIKLQKSVQSEYDLRQSSFIKVKEEVNEKNERSQLFESLFKEGVVSRKEMEQAHSDAQGADSDISEAESKITELEAKLKTIAKFIAKKSDKDKSKKTSSH